MFPGQGSQFKGMGKEVFDQFPELVSMADDILGYSIKELCLADADKKLGFTQFTQPALYVVNALSYLSKDIHNARFLAGHSLGEFNALFAAEVFDFETGLRLVKKRGELMAQARNGGMAAVIGVDAEKVKTILENSSETRLDIANYNSPSQTVISGPKEALAAMEGAFDKQGARYIILPVSAAFHSRYMAEYSTLFGNYLEGFEFNTPLASVISNVTARPYESGKEITQCLVKQMRSPVRWTESVQYMLAHGEKSAIEVGPGDVLTKLFVVIKKDSSSETIAKITQEIESNIKINSRLLEQQTEQLTYADGRIDKNIQKAVRPKKIVESSAVPADRLNYKKQTESLSFHAQEKVLKDSVLGLTENSKASAAQSSVMPFGNPSVYKNSVSSGGDFFEVNSKAKAIEITGMSMGSEILRKEYGVKYAYFVGGMHKGISSKEMIVRLSNAGILGFYGASGLPLEKVKCDLQFIIQSLSPGQTFGVNIKHQIHSPSRDENLIPLLLEKSVRAVELSGYTRITWPLVQYRYNSSSKYNDQWIVPNKVVVKASSPEIVELFMSPAPGAVIDQLLSSGKLTEEEAEIARVYPMCDDVCIETDSALNTESDSLMTLFPIIRSIRDQLEKCSSTGKRIRVGVAGGIGSPEAVASSFLMGADFILTGSINQCSVEAGTSDTVKNILQSAKVQDIGYAPSEELFEMGARNRVMRRGIFFSSRATKLFNNYKQLDSLDKMDSSFLNELETHYFNCDINKLSHDLISQAETEGQAYERNSKQAIAHLIRSYMKRGDELAIRGDISEKSNYRVVTSPAIGAFNEYVKGSDLQGWRHRHVDAIAVRLMNDGAVALKKRLQQYLMGVS